MSFRFLREFISPLNVCMFYEEIEKIAEFKKDKKCLNTFKEYFGVFYEEECLKDNERFWHIDLSNYFFRICDK